MWKTIICMAFLVGSACDAGAQNLPRASAISEGLSAKRLSAIGALMDARIHSHDIPGALAIVARNGHIVYEHAAGYSNVAEKTPLTADAIFRFHSMTKPVICAAALILVDDGKLKLDDPVAKYIPAFASMGVYVRGAGASMVTEALSRPVTIRDLMRHMSGFTYADFEPWSDPGDGPVDALYDSRKMAVVKFPTLEAAVDEAVKLPLLFQPGTRWHYGMSIDILGYVIEKASGLSLGEFLQQRLFGPLNARDAGFVIPDDKLDRFTTMYESRADGLKLATLPKDSSWRNPARAQSGGGGLIGTAGDYLNFAQMLLNDGTFNGIRILSKHAVEEMRKDQLPPGVKLSAWTQLGSPIGFGFGVAVETDVARRGVAGCNGTFFWSGSERTYFWVDPRLKIVGLWMSQAFKNPDQYKSGDTFNTPVEDMRRVVYGALLDQKSLMQCRK